MNKKLIFKISVDIAMTGVLLFVFDYIAIMSVFMLIGHYLAKLLKISGKKSAKTE